MERPIGQLWQRIHDWLALHAPVTAAAIQPPAEAAEVARVRDAVDRPLPVDLIHWWGRMDGIADVDYRAGCPIPPFYRPLPVGEVRERFAGLLRFAERECCGAGGTHATTAGERSFGYCTATVPICADIGGDLLVVDLREGARRGCVTEWTAEEGFIPTAWDGIGAMLADVADRLSDPAQTEIVDDGALEWT